MGTKFLVPRVCVCVCVCVCGGGGGGGGGYSNFFRIRRLGPSIYDSPQKKYQEFQAPQKNLKF